MKVTSYIYSLMPRYLVSRFLLIIILPIIIGQLLAIYIFYDRHWSNILNHTSQIIADEVSFLINIAKQDGIPKATNAAKALSFQLTIKQSNNKKSPLPREELQILAKQIENRINSKVIVSLVEPENRLAILIKLGNKEIQLTRSAKPLINPTTYIFVLWVVGLTILLLLVSLLFLRSQIRSILELAEAADSFGKGALMSAEYKPSGAMEIRRAGMAFIRMKERIERNIGKRTQMLAMISHDLKTPLTRMKLQLAMMEPTPEVQSIEEDASSMQQMIVSYLDFARGEGGEAFVTISFQDWAAQHIDKLLFPNLTMKIADELPLIRIKPNAFKRAIGNILVNAHKYATQTKLTCIAQDEMVFIIIEDNGAGINDEEKAMVFKPFYRSDSSRHLGIEGSVGLGLTITQEIILAHNGTIDLDDSPSLGGVRMTISLPVA